ncbi:MAG: SH2 domain-containing protein [Anaerolineae bacterium]
MSRIDTTWNCATAAFSDWTQRHLDQVKSHPAWCGIISEQESHRLLESEEPLTYLLRGIPEDFTYFISFIKPDGSIKHQRFVLEMDRKGWYYKNGGTDKPEEIIADTIAELIPLMMHCPSSECKTLERLHR